MQEHNPPGDCCGAKQLLLPDMPEAAEGIFGFAASEEDAAGKDQKETDWRSKKKAKPVKRRWRLLKQVRGEWWLTRR